MVKQVQVKYVAVVLAAAISLLLVARQNTPLEKSQPMDYREVTNRHETALVSPTSEIGSRVQITSGAKQLPAVQAPEKGAKVIEPEFIYLDWVPFGLNITDLRKMFATGDISQENYLDWLNQIPDEVLESFLRRYTSFDDTFFSRFNNPYEARRRIAELWQAHDELEHRSEVTGMAVSPFQDQGQMVTSVSQFGSEVRSVFFSYQVPDGYRSSDMLLKVQDLSSGTIWTLDKVDIDSSRSRQQLWIRFEDSWESGKYRATLYSSEENFEPLDQVDFDVLPPDDSLMPL